MLRMGQKDKAEKSTPTNNQQRKQDGVRKKKYTYYVINFKLEKKNFQNMSLALW